MSNKRYYWLKLQDNFFEKEEIKIIENMPNGKDYIIFYMKLLLKSVSTEGKLMFREIIPYTPEMLASITNTNVDTVRVAIDMFSKLDLMEIWDDGTLFMVETQNMIGSETKWAKKKRLQREKQKDLPSKGDNVLHLSSNCPREIDTEIELEIELDKDIEISSNYVEFFNNNFHLITKYELDTLKSYEDDKLESNLITLALQKAVDKDKRSLDYVKGILNNWVKDNVRTVEQAKAKEKEFIRNKAGGKDGGRSKLKYNNKENKSTAGEDRSEQYDLSDL